MDRHPYRQTYRLTYESQEDYDGDGTPDVLGESVQEFDFNSVYDFEFIG